MQPVFIQNGGLYSSLNAGQLPPLDSIQSADDLHKASRSHSKSFKLTWSSNTYIWPAFIPTTMRLNNPLFQRLAFSHHSLPIEQTSNRYHLARELQHRWYRLEANLQDIILKLVKARDARFRLVIGSNPCLPSSFGYLRDHKDKRHAIRCARNSCAAFMPLVAMVSFAMALLAHGPDDLTSSEPYWKKVLKREGVHHVWVDNLHTSMAGDFSHNSRVGVVLNMHNCMWLETITALVRARVPLWFYWGKAEGPLPATTNHAGYKYPIIAEYLPTATDIASARAQSGSQLPLALTPSSLHQPTFSNKQLPGSEPRRLPCVEPNTRQIDGQTWQEFFAAQEERHARRAARQSPAERDSRLQRETLQQNYQEPGRRGPTVFRWEDNDGFRVRVRMNRGEVSTWWCEYSHSQKRYNSFKNEWDICTEFDPDGHPDDEEFDDELDELDEMIPHCPQSPGGLPSYPPPSPCYQEDLTTVYHHNVCPNAFSLTSSSDILSWMYRRYGFTPDLSGSTYVRQDYKGMPLELPGWHETCRKAGYWDPQNDLPTKFQEPISDFIFSFITVGFAPGCIWDLSARSKQFLRDRTNHVVRVTKRRVMHKDNQFFYFLDPIYPAFPSSPFYLAVPHAASAVQCLREQWGPDFEDIIRHFLSIGIPFSTRIPGPLPGPSVPPRPRCGLGYRPVGYQPDLNDHAAYENARLAFLSSERRARAALMKGGIVWRLVQDALYPDEVLAGPTPDCMHPHLGHALTFSDGQVLWDDDLSEEEMDLICGVYKVSTGQGIQNAHCSWWPKQSMWNRCKMNVGFWPPAAEFFFQTRRESIRNGTAKLLNAAEWEAKLKLHRKAGPLAQKYEDAASRFLDGVEFT